MNIKWGQPASSKTIISTLLTPRFFFSLNPRHLNLQNFPIIFCPKFHSSQFTTTTLYFTMIPHSYATDAQSKSADLASTIVAASTPDQIATVCASVDSFLHKHSPDQSRWFFSITFPTLICKLFGFDDQKPPNPNANGWIDVLATEVSDKNASQCDVFSDLCPLFKGRLKDGGSLQVQLNILEYYLFWFVYYPVSKGRCDNRTSSVSSRVSKRFRLETWAIPVFGNAGKPRGNEPKNRNGGSLYVRLLHAYLRFFVPLSDLNAQSPYRSSLLHYSSSYDSSVLENAEFFVHTLVNFWIVDNDFSPLPVKQCKSFGVVLPLRSVLAELPPTAGLGEVVNVFVKYLNSSLLPNSVEGCDQVELSKATSWRATGSVDMKYRDMFSGMGSLGYWNSCIQRPLYRYILRTFLFCPVETSVKNVSQVFSLWVNYMEPWVVSLDEFPEMSANADSLKRDSVKEVDIAHPCEYSSSWQGFVLSNYLFYSSLVMHFIGFAHKFIHTDPELIVQMVSKVVNILTASKELMNLIKNVDIVFHSNPAGLSKSMLNSLYRFVPAIREQLQDWEDGLSESEADGSFLHENWNKDLKLFSTSEDGGQQLFQLLALRAESELQVISHENLPNNLQLLSSLKSRMGCLFGGNIITNPTVLETGKQPEKSQHEIFRPRTAGNRPTTDIRYKGDWMKRPISKDEVAWLANLLVKLSGWLNDILGLNSRESGHVGPSRRSYVEVSGDTGTNVYGAKDTLRLVIRTLCCWVMMLGSVVVELMREHGVRVNLRILASKKIVTVVVMAIAFSTLRRMFSKFHVIE
ncbi:hypothetical protein HanRHA438_Chr16g0756701 [Helianthus annuus]|nr:hypothetical protein HanHA300_Chr16g0607521 [Helianthus annuus]KAJ0442463.1 hypothetical protein HanIR_Chr16g0809601 [Helianthus annuus]KAJ0460214.1 hypothetical protein HanHA89_Chr16g0658111 [Helianthus annuus]KAJ0640653.1 hypothetical protein HanLR1_Chr16g0618071 [Helianthus annuus]KAJ0644577.1 hypothetical protein HanOQP8_Chr16g0613821 [Helianthus annuus]